MHFPELFSKRGKTRKAVREDFPTHVRNRLFLLLSRLQDDLHDLLSRIQLRLTERYGEFTPCLDRRLHPAAYHFLASDDDQAFDFIEAVFQCARDFAGAQHLVDDFNKVFREEGIGYELTPMTQSIVKGGGTLHGHQVHAFLPTYPIVRKKENTPQEVSMTHCLDLLTDPAFKIANDQFLKAHQHYRASEWDQTIAYCGSAFESVLKVVLGKKGVKFREGATANALILECVNAGIFPQTYENSLIGIANVRNVMSDSTHGKTPATQIVPEQKNAEHLLFVTAANIVFVSKCVQ